MLASGGKMNAGNIHKSSYPGTSQSPVEPSAHDYFAMKLIGLDGLLTVEWPPPIHPWAVSLAGASEKNKCINIYSFT